MASKMFVRSLEREKMTVICSFCVLVAETYPKGLSQVENQSTVEIIQAHARVTHGVSKESLEKEIPI